MTCEWEVAFEAYVLKVEEIIGRELQEFEQKVCRGFWFNGSAFGGRAMKEIIEKEG